MRPWRSFLQVSISLSLAWLNVDTARAAGLGDLRGVVQAHFNHDASRVVTRTGQGEIGIWDTKKGTAVSGDAALKKPAEAYLMSPDGRKVLISFKDGHARVFDASSGAAVSPVLDLALPESDNPRAVFSPDASSLVYFGEKDSIVLDVKTGKKQVSLPVRFKLDETSDSTASAIFTKDGTKCFVSDFGGTVTAYDARKWTATGKPMSHPPAEMSYTFGFDASSDGKWVVTFDDPGENGPNGNLQVWDTSTSQPLGEPLTGKNGMTGRFLPGQDRVLVGAGRGDATVRELPSLAVSYEVKKHDELDGPTTAVFPNGKWFLAWGSDKKIDLIDAATGKILGSASFSSGISWVTIAPDSSACYLAPNESTVQRLSVPELKATGTANVMDNLVGPSISQDGRWFLILQGNSDDGRIAIFETTTMKPIEWAKP